MTATAEYSTRNKQLSTPSTAATQPASKRMVAEFAFVVSSGLAGLSFVALTLWQAMVG